MTVSEKPVPWKEYRLKYRRSLMPFVLIEWALKWVRYQSQGSATFWFFEVAGWIATVAAVVVGVTTWFWEADDRVKERHYRAWELINSARGSTGDGGRRQAIQDLLEDRVSLQGIVLNKAHLVLANFKKADFNYADMREANLNAANLSGSTFLRADLSGASLFDANLSGAILYETNLTRVNFLKANLRNAVIYNVNIEKAKFCETIMPDGTLNNRDCPAIPALPDPGEMPSPPN